jgi:ubiquinone biosynthesis protein
VRIGSLPKDFDRDALRVEIGEFVADYIGQSLDEFDLSGALNGMTDIIRRYRIILPPTISLLLRVLVMLEGTGRLLNPRFSLAGLLQPYYAKAMQRRLSPQVWLRKLQRTYRDWDRLLDMLPKDLADVLTRLRRGTFDVNLEHRRLDSTVNRLVLGILTAALFLGSSQLWSSEAPPLIGGVSVFGAVGYGLSIFLGFLLFVAIKKSETRRGRRGR